ncbi:MAG: SH3 domain-containing protein [Tagaea sp.]|nr:SH3 domain-containing protein [Tagaea sp.]
MHLRYLAMIPALAALAACVPDGVTPVTQATQVPAVEPVQCAQPLGPLAIRDPANVELLGMLTRIGIDSPANALRVIAQQSGCFDVRDAATIDQRLTARRNEIERERGAARSANRPFRAPAEPVLGETILVLQPSMSISLPSVTTAPGAPQRANTAPVAGQQTQNVLDVIAPGVRNVAASISLMAIELESGRQVGVAQGAHTNAELDIAAALLGSQARGLGMGYTQTVEGRTILVALQKAFNGLVDDMRARDIRTAGQPAAPAPAPPPATPERVAPPFRANSDFTVAAGVNFRAAPVNGAIKRALHPGARVKTTERIQGVWWEVEFEGDTGWVSSQFLRAP